MKSLIYLEPEALRVKDAAQFIGVSTQVLDRARAAGWISPCVRAKRLTSYRPTHLRILLNKIEADGLPPKSGNADLSHRASNH